MKTRIAFAGILLSAMPWAGAQNVRQEPQEDPVQEAIREFNNHDSGKSNEVTVVLDPVGVPPAPVDESKKVEEKTDTIEQAGPVLVTGKPPQGTELIDKDAETAETAENPAKEPPPKTQEEPAPKPQKGLAVRVEKIQTGDGVIDPSKIKLLAPFPAKPLAQPPAGWRLESSENAPPFTREIELSPGKKITLNVRPHLLVPEADGTAAFHVSEPGFDPSLGYRQNATVGAILSNSIRQLDEDSKQLGAAIDNLQQLLVSLPKAEPPTDPKTEASRKR